MLARITSILRKDIAYSRRDNIMLYMVLFPVIMAIILSLFLPAMENMEMTFAVNSAIPTDVIAKLQEFSKVELYDNNTALEQRVLEFDDVPGIYLAEGEYKVLLEGNEMEAIQDLPEVILQYIHAEQPVGELSTVSMGETSSSARELSAIFLILGCIGIGGLSIGLNIVNDRETKTLKALSVSPLSTAEYIVAKSLLALLLALLLSLAVAGILIGGQVNYLLLTVTIMCALGTGIMAGLALGLAANNQITAIAVVKVIFLVYTGIPIASLFIPQKWLVALYPFPNYWAFEALRRFFLEAEAGLLIPNVISLVASFIVIAAMLPVVKRKFHLG